MKLDLKEKKILHELDKNARISFSEIAKRIRLSKNSVINRIKELEKEEIILGYNTLININSLGYTTYDIYLKFKNTNYEKEKEIINMSIGILIKTIQDIMRKDVGVDGDAQRISQIVWLIFLKIFSRLFLYGPERISQEFLRLFFPYFTCNVGLHNF